MCDYNNYSNGNIGPKKLKKLTLNRSIKINVSLAIATLVLGHDEDAVDVLHPVQVEGPVALNLVTDG